MDIGIDLGTTHSAIAIRGEVVLADGSGGERHPAGVTVIPSPLGERTFPSVVWINPENRDDVLVGTEALQKAEEGGSPILFSKRAIGTDELLSTGPYKVTARHVATLILKYLKACAERSLGTVVERAVITHPAYFTPNQIEETRQAAIDAGFDMSLPEQMLMEPAAAALAFLRGDARDPLTVLTYDLGGGTFDVTILERTQGLTTLKAFDGDRLLGGYNFDKRLANWIVQRIEGGGRKVAHDPDDAEDRGRYARLLLLAEDVKIRLTQQFTDKVAVQVRAPNILLDTDGRPIPILERMTRAEFKHLIAAELERTVQCCRGALARASLAAEDVQLILLVGGSTYGQWVTETLAAAFPGIPIDRGEPDLDVAAGAALRAANLPPRSAAAHGIRVTLDNVPAKTLLPSINVGGTVTAEDGGRLDATLRARLRVLLQTHRGATLAPAALDDAGNFHFADVELEFEAPTTLKLTVADDQGLRRFETQFTIEHGSSLGDDRVYPSLPRELSIPTADGQLPIANEGAVLPARVEVELGRVHADAVLSIPIHMEDIEVGAVRITDLPTDRGAAGSVILSLEVTREGEIRGETTVLTNRGETIGTKRVRIMFPPLVIPALAELRARYDDLESQRDEDAQLSPDNVRRLQLLGAGQLASEELRQAFGELQPDRQEIFDKLRRFERMVRPARDDMSPTKAEFLQRADYGRRRIDALGTHPSARDYQGLLDELVRRGETVHASRNRRKWSQVNHSLEQLLARLQPPPGDPRPPDPTPLLKDSFLQSLDQRRMVLDAARSRYAEHPDYEPVFRARYEQIEREIGEMEKAVAAIDDDLEPPQGLARLRVATRGMDTLDERIELVTIDVRGVAGRARRG